MPTSSTSNANIWQATDLTDVIVIILFRTSLIIQYLRLVLNLICRSNTILKLKWNGQQISNTTDDSGKISQWHCLSTTGEHVLPPCKYADYMSGHVK